MRAIPGAATRRVCAASVIALAAALASHPAAAAEGGAAAAAVAADAPPQAEEKADYGNRVSELTVVGESPVITNAPVKASLEATQPQAIVTREAIDQFVSQTGGYPDIVVLTPSASGLSFNGPGFYETKTTLRGFKDGEYNVTYDGIPFGDTNDPTHHSTTFFPASTVAAVVVDRGPGQAGQLGQANFGGSINLFSPEVTDDARGSVQGLVGSWGSYQARLQYNTGAVDALHGAKLLVNATALGSQGYLQNVDAQGVNFLMRGVVPLPADWKATFYSVYNYSTTHLNDNDGATLQEVALFGKNFGLNNDPKTPQFTGYNWIRKRTNLNYVRLDGDLTSSTHVENTAYTYYYANRTLSSLDDTVIVGTGTKAGPKGNTDVPGYTKLNYYHVYGDILRVTQDIPWGEVKAGIWWETSKTKRARYDLDLTLNVHDPREKTAPLDVNYLQFSTWDQYQPFVDLELKPTEALTITPGIKYVHFERDVATDVNQKTRTPLKTSATYTKTLYFLTANYKLQENWSAYAQYATGFLIPALSVLQTAAPNTTGLSPQTSTNYQVGTVFHGGRFTFDGDVYYITFKNKLQSVKNATTGETDWFNLGGATYKGVEAQGTYAVKDDAFVFLNGSLNSAKAKGGQTTIAGQTMTITGGKQIAGAPEWTAAAGLIWRPGDWSLSITDKFVGQQWGGEGEPSNFKIGAYSDIDLTAVYRIEDVRLEAAVYNALNSQHVTKISPAGSGNVIDPADQYYFQPERFFQFSVRYEF
jgi:iron complex outermembrane receptor protein